jgi:hypothetical protein
MLIAAFPGTSLNVKVYLSVFFVAVGLFQKIGLLPNILALKTGGPKEKGAGEKNCQSIHNNIIFRWFKDKVIWIPTPAGNHIFFNFLAWCPAKKVASPRVMSSN